MDSFIARVSRILQLIKHIDFYAVDRLWKSVCVHNINTLEFSTCRHDANDKSWCHFLAAGGNAEASG